MATKRWFLSGDELARFIRRYTKHPHADYSWWYDTVPAEASWICTFPAGHSWCSPLSTFVFAGAVVRS